MRYVPFIAKWIAILLVALAVFTVFGVPLVMTFTSNGQPPSFSFFWCNLLEFVPLLPLFLAAIVLTVAFRLWARYRLGDVGEQAYKREMLILGLAEISLLVIAILVLVPAVQGLGATLT